MLFYSGIFLNLEKLVVRGIIVQDIGFTVLSKKLNFTLRLSGHFLEVLWNQWLALESVSN
jgi:hypothetical protein